VTEEQEKKGRGAQRRRQREEKAAAVATPKNADGWSTQRRRRGRWSGATFVDARKLFDGTPHPEYAFAM